jgi:hypothetical protein
MLPLLSPSASRLANWAEKKQVPRVGFALGMTTSESFARQLSIREAP